jgi:hypothetical protein
MVLLMVSIGMAETNITTVTHFRALWTVHAFECEFRVETSSSRQREGPISKHTKVLEQIKIWS